MAGIHGYLRCRQPRRGNCDWQCGKDFKRREGCPWCWFHQPLGGALVGLVEGALILGLLVGLAQRLEVSASLTEYLEGSRVASLLGAIGNSLMPLLPEAIRGVKAIINV